MHDNKLMPENLRKRFSRSFLKLEKRLPLEKFIPVALLIFLLIVFILSIITYKNIEEYQKQIEWVEHTNKVIKQVDRLNIEIFELPLLRRAYVLTGDGLYLTENDSLSVHIDKEINFLRVLTNDNKEMSAYIDQLDTLSSRNMRFIETSVMRFKDKTDSFDLQADLTRNVQQNLSEIKKLSERMKSEEVQLLNERTARARSTNQTIQGFIITTGLFSFLIIGLSIYISSQLIRNKNLAEQLLQKSYEEMEQKVEVRTLALKESNDKLSDEIITRQRIESTLRESQERFRSLADSSPVFIWVRNKNGIMTYINKTFVDFTGITTEQIRHDPLLLIHESDRGKYKERIESALREQKPFELEYRIRSKDDEYKWVFDKGIPMYEGSEFAGLIGSSVDIDSRKKNETYLRIQYEVSKTLAEAKTMEEMTEKVLKNICSGITWNFGIFWSINKKNFHVDSIWSENENDHKEFSEHYNKFYTLPIEKGLPGMVLSSGKSQWITDINNDKDFIRKEAAKSMGWKSGLGIPISNGEEVIAIIECFNKTNIPENEELYEVLESAGRQIGNFIFRKKAESELTKYHEELEEKVTERTNELASTLGKLLKEIKEKEEIQNRIKLFAHTIRSIRDCVYITDLEGKVIFVNKAFEETYGYTSAELINKEIPVLDGKNVDKIQRSEIMNKTLEEGWRGELVTTKKDGTSFHTYLSTSSIKNDEGKIEALVGVCQDITDLKKQAELINKRNNLLNILNDVIKVTNKSFDLSESIKYSINKVCQYTGWDIGHCFIKKNDLLVSTYIWNDNLIDKYEPFKSKSETFTFRINEGTPGEVLMHGKAIWRNIDELKDPKIFKRDGIAAELGLKTGLWVPIQMKNEVIGVLEFYLKDHEVIDPEILECIYNIGIELGSVCEKIETIELTKKGERSLNAAQHIARLGSWEYDVKRNRITWSDEMYSIYGIDKSEKITYETYLARIHPDDIENVKKTVSDSIRTKMPFDYHHKIITTTGEVKILRAQGEVFTDEHGEVERLFGTGHDITKLVTVEEQLRHTNEMLIQAQKELIHNEKLAALGRFSSGVAHEIRNPLANIHSLAQLVLKADLDEKNKKRLKYILTNSDIANNIIKNLLNFASPTELTYTRSDISEILHNILESVEARCKMKNIKIVRKIPGKIPVMNVDRLRLENAFMNFISNSIDSMNDGGTLTVNAEVGENEISVDVIDTGIGIPPENMDKILEPFFTTKDEGVGLGMGLAHQTIRQHQGTIQIESDESKGTSIKVILPLKKN